MLYKIGKEGGGGCACLWPWLNDLVQVLAKELFPMKSLQNRKHPDKWGGDSALATWFNAFW